MPIIAQTQEELRRAQRLDPQPGTVSALLACWGIKAKQKLGAYVLFVDPAQIASDAHPIWSAEAGAATLCAVARPILPATSPADIVSVSDLPAAVHLLIDHRKRSHLLLERGNLALQLLIEGADLLSGPVCLNFIVPGIARISRAIEKLATLRQILTRPSNLSYSSIEWSAYSLSLRNALIALDGHAAGASYRDVAEVVFGKTRVARDWPDPLKDRIRRSLRRGQALANGGYRTLIA